MGFSVFSPYCCPPTFLQPLSPYVCILLPVSPPCLYSQRVQCCLLDCLLLSGTPGLCLCHSFTILVAICLCWPVPSFSCMSICHLHLLYSVLCLLPLLPFTAQCLGLIVSHCSFYFKELNIYVLCGLPISCS